MLSLLTTLLTAACDAPEPWQIGFQDGASPSFEGITELHHTIFFYLLVIGFTVLWVLGSIVLSFVDSRAPIAHRYNNHGTLIEVVWTIVPAFILVAIAFPSFKLLYLMDLLSFLYLFLQNNFKTLTHFYFSPHFFSFTKLQRKKIKM